METAGGRDAGLPDPYASGVDASSLRIAGRGTTGPRAGRTPAFTVVALLTLTLGIGANTAINQLFDAIQLRTLSVGMDRCLPGRLVPVAGFQVVNDLPQAYVEWASDYPKGDP
jgi:hypothetical protein